MRILLINHEYPPLGGGAGNATAQIARQLVQLGVETAIVTTRFRGQPVYEQVEGVTLYRVNTPRQAVDRSSLTEFMAFMALGTLPTLNFCRDWKPDVTIAFFGIPGGPVAYIARLLQGTPYLVSLRGGDVPGFWYRGLEIFHTLSKPVILWVWNHSAGLVANSKGLQQLAEKSHPKVPVSLIPNGVDCDRFCPNLSLRSPSTIRILIVGRLVIQKGLDLLLTALSKLLFQPPQELPAIQLDVVGDGSDRAWFESQVQQMGLTEHVKFWGWVDRNELPKCYQQANIFAFPSRDEGMPNVVLEAMACGLPVLASRIAGNEDLVEDERTGLLIPNEDVGALTASLRRLIVDSELRDRLGQAGRQRVEQQFSWRQVAEKYLTLARTVVGDRSKQ